MSATIRVAIEDDAAANREIYAPFCENSIVSFEEAAQSAGEMASRIRKISEHFPWLVLAKTMSLRYAYASACRARSLQVVCRCDGLREPAFARGVAGRWPRRCSISAAAGFFKIYAGISLPNPASTGFHEAMGFQPVGIYNGVGYKFGAWHDVAHYQLTLQAERKDPERPRPPELVIGTPGWTDAVIRGLRHYRPLSA